MSIGAERRREVTDAESQALPGKHAALCVHFLFPRNAAVP